ncbi:hypothetical protein PS15m_009844 [Mucor circinelloides]
MKASVAPLMMRIVTTRGGDKPNHWVTIKLRHSINLKWATIDKLYRKAEVIFDCSNSNAPSKYRWKSFTTPVESLYKLNGAVPTLLLHKLKHAHIQKKYRSSNSLRLSVFATFDSKNYYVSPNAVDIFQALIDSQGITNITVQPHPHAIEEASCIVTPEHINRQIQLIKDDMKLDWTRSQTVVKY